MARRHRGSSRFGRAAGLTSALVLVLTGTVAVSGFAEAPASASPLPTTAAVAPEQTATLTHETETLGALWPSAGTMPVNATKAHIVLPAELAGLRFSGLAWSVYSGIQPTLEGFADGTSTAIDVDLPDVPAGTSLGVTIREVTGPMPDYLDLRLDLTAGGTAPGAPDTGQVVLELAAASSVDIDSRYRSDPAPALLIPGSAFQVTAPAGFWSSSVGAAAQPGSTDFASVALTGDANGAVYPLEHTISADGGTLVVEIPQTVPTDAADLTVSYTHPRDRQSRSSTYVFRTRILLDHTFTADRIGGADRYAVSASVAQRAFPDGAQVAFVVTGENFPDALTAAPAAVQQRGPLLLTQRDSIPPAVLSELQSLHPSQIVVVGGPASVSDAVLTALQGIAPAERIGGADRYEVSRNVLTQVFPSSIRRAYIATGNTYPDALSAGAAAGTARLPVMLVDGTASGLDPATTDALRAYDLYSMTIVGGEASVSPAVARDLGAITMTSRVGGADRYAVSRALMTSVFPSASHGYLVSGAGFSDALVGSALAGEEDVPVFAVHPDCVPAETIAAAKRQQLATVTLIGGPATLSQSVLDLTPC